MATSDEPARLRRTAEINIAVRFFTEALQTASKGYSPSPPELARAAIRTALVGTIQLISHLYPDEPSFPAPLNQLLYALNDLDHGKVPALLKPTKVFNRPGTALSEDLFRAIVAAAMTRRMETPETSRTEAARDIARRLSKMGGKHSSGAVITASQIGKWRESSRAGCWRR